MNEQMPKEKGLLGKLMSSIGEQIKKWWSTLDGFGKSFAIILGIQLLLLLVGLCNPFGVMADSDAMVLEIIAIIEMGFMAYIMLLHKGIVHAKYAWLEKLLLALVGVVSIFGDIPILVMSLF